MVLTPGICSQVVGAAKRGRDHIQHQIPLASPTVRIFGGCGSLKKYFVKKKHRVKIRSKPPGFAAATSELVKGIKAFFSHLLLHHSIPI